MKTVEFNFARMACYDRPVCSVSELAPEGVLCSSQTGAGAEGVTDEEYTETIW